MNRKQSKMLRQMKASKQDIDAWKRLSKAQKGELRKFHNENEKAAYFSFSMAMAELKS